jgi:uncharacterized protein RhaS with RHS repeats
LRPIVGIDDDFNLYAYVGNDPLNKTDPTGTEGTGCWNNGAGCGPKPSDQETMAGVREAGRQGERAAGVDPGKPKERVESRTGTAKYRIPDESDKTSIKETKNVKQCRTLKGDFSITSATARQFSAGVAAIDGCPESPAPTRRVMYVSSCCCEICLCPCPGAFWCCTI